MQKIGMLGRHCCTAQNHGNYPYTGTYLGLVMISVDTYDLRIQVETGVLRPWCDLPPPDDNAWLCFGFANALPVSNRWRPTNRAGAELLQTLVRDHGAKKAPKTNVFHQTLISG